MIDLLNKLKRISMLRHERVLFDFLKLKGVPSDQIQVIPEKFADRKLVEGEDYYYYSGPLDEKTRPFCRKLLQLDKVISSLDIEILTNYLNYDVLKYRGSYNCRHKWVKFRGKRILTPELTVGQIKDLVRKGIKG